MFRRKAKLTAGNRKMRYAARKAATAVAILLFAGAMILADRMGVFGGAPQSDFVAYDGKTFRVVGVIDGDTLEIDARDRNKPYTRVRLWGVDTPEVYKDDFTEDHFGRQASRRTRELTLRKLVKLDLQAGRNTRCKFGRLLAYVLLPDGRMLNRLLIEEGFGYADPRFNHDLRGEFSHLQTRAIKAGCGLWKDVKKSDLPRYYSEKLKLPK